MPTPDSGPNSPDRAAPDRPGAGALPSDEALRALALKKTVADEIAKVYIGDIKTTDLLLVALLARGHVLLEGVPGIAKTTLIKTFARTLGCRFARVQFTPDLLPADITGTYVLDLRDSTFVLRKGPIFANVVLADEINRAPAKTQSALLEAMQENQVTIEGQTQELPTPFVVLATQNPVEQEGVYLLPEAQVDRFLFKIVLGYPSYDEERRVLSTYNVPVPNVEMVLSPEDIHGMAAAAERVFIAPSLLDYIVRLVQHTRTHHAVLLGASPRASLALMRCSKALAFLHGRDHVLPDDVRSLVTPVLNHRIILSPEAELDQISVGEVLAECLAAVPYNREA
ncbi:MAG: magnesium chelatase [Deltaproteobacteria bacterium HGW-Deltaproteobacteria-14]|jgi:MoxR-like ATPase|nr:MAG: magnesium chelatase [Deltaproteobacteria bacterium HGW-Deltaproteobacteria-14]